MLGLRRVVWASSETILGLPFEREQPAYAPIDEEHPPLPGVELRALEALVGGARSPAASLDGDAVRRAPLLEHHGAGGLRAVSLVLGGRDVCAAGTSGATSTCETSRQSCRLALEADVGAEHFIVAAADTVMNRPSRELMAEVYPSVPYRPTAGEFDTLLSIEKARKLLGYEAQWSWRDHVENRSAAPS